MSARDRPFVRSFDRSVRRSVREKASICIHVARRNIVGERNVRFLQFTAFDCEIAPFVDIVIFVVDPRARQRSSAVCIVRNWRRIMNTGPSQSLTMGERNSESIFVTYIRTGSRKKKRRERERESALGAGPPGGNREAVISTFQQSRCIRPHLCCFARVNALFFLFDGKRQRSRHFKTRDAHVRLS